MANHKFGIMTDAPGPGQRFDSYNPWDYEDVITVDDEYIEPLLEALTEVKLYAHTVDVPYPGLAYCGITLIPPSAMDSFSDVIKASGELAALQELLEKAKEGNKYIIHFGL